MSAELYRALLLALGILLAGGVAFASLFNALVLGESVEDRLHIYAAIPDVFENRSHDRRRARFMRMRLRLNSVLSAFVPKELNNKLLSANWPITETEFVLIRLWGVILGFILGWLIFRTPLVGIGIAIVAYLVPGLVLLRSIQQRQLKFEKQLVDVLVLIKGAVRTGYSFLQALDLVEQEMEAPASEEFRRVRQEVGLGLPLSQALLNMNARMQNDDLYLIVTAVNINSQVGGNLTTMLEAVTNTIRERVRLFSEVRALTSQQRFSGNLLSALPFIVVGVLFIINPEYISKLFEPGIFLCIPVGALIMILIGNIVIRLLSRIEV